MSLKFSAGIHQRDEVTFIKLGGVIDEDNELAELTEKIQPGTAIIDLAEIERINSCGVRDWVNWLGRIESEASVVLVECSPAIVAQINLVNNFTGKGVVKSFYVPYFCPECDEEKVLLCEVREMGPAPHEPPTCRCDECDLVMDFDDMPDSYFAFLTNTGKLGGDETKLNAVLSEFNSGEGEKSKIRSRVGTSTTLSSSGTLSSLPSVPSLPSIARTGITESGLTGPGGYGQVSTLTQAAPVAPPIHPAPTNEGVPRLGFVEGKSNTLLYILVGLLLVAIMVLVILLKA